MNANQIINMVVRVVMRKAINKGINVGMGQASKLSGKVKQRARPAADFEPHQRNDARPNPMDPPDGNSKPAARMADKLMR